MKELLEQYKAAKEVADGLASQLYVAFMSTSTVEEKYKLVLEYGDEFLREEGYYCPHVRTSKGEVSLYDDLYVERHQTLTLDQLMDCIYDDFDLIDWDADDIEAEQIKHAGAVVNQDTARAAILRDMLNNGIRAGTFDW
ncbi:hypothetical protein D3C73_980970 [compost metagenome]